MEGDETRLGSGEGAEKKRASHDLMLAVSEWGLWGGEDWEDLVLFLGGTGRGLELDSLSCPGLERGGGGGGGLLLSKLISGSGKLA